jgi:hypothetical protein
LISIAVRRLSSRVSFKHPDDQRSADNDALGEERPTRADQDGKRFPKRGFGELA